ncbi:MAG: sulfatase [Bacteroidota bacterium]|jgi:phosphoglycerol transferase MdoB-like AlkP superfamily enzyme|nr:sulfatase [Bacteroidota bacterium]
MLKTAFRHIPASIKLLAKLYFISLIVFFLIRLTFVLYNQSDLECIQGLELLMAFERGLEFDTAVFCWTASIPTLTLLLWRLSRKLLFAKIGLYISLFLLQLFFFISVADIPYFKQFGNHLNRTAFLWNENPSFAAGVIFGNIWYWGFIFVFIPLAVIFAYCFKKCFHIFRLQVAHEPPKKPSYALVEFAVTSALIFSGARGQIFEKTGLHEGMAIVSQNGFANHIAINANYTFWKSLLKANKTSHYAIPKGVDHDIAFTRKYLGIQSPYERNIKRSISDTSNQSLYNIVIVVMESMCQFKMGYYNGENKTPHLDNLIRESVFFNNFFSSGIHTFNGLFSTTSGYPSIYDEHSMRSYVKKSFNGLGALLQARGYETYFYTTHDPNFDNMKGYFTLNKFEHIISEKDFDPSLSEGSLGVPDHVLLEKIVHTGSQRKSGKPFLAVAMTASDHGPWRIPKNIPFKPNGKTPQDNCTLYADWSIGRFIELAKKQTWYNNTVFIFLGDHGLSMGHTYEMPISYHHVPCIIHQPRLFVPDTISSPCYQPDIPATVMGIIGGSYVNETFGINILKEQHPFVVFSADDKIGCVDNQGNYYYQTLSNGEVYLRKYTNLDATNFKTSRKEKADSMHKNMMHIYEAARYFLRTDYFLYE